MTVTSGHDLYYDPYDVGINADPYPVFRRLREAAQLYYNERYDFFAVSRYEDVERGFKDRATFISGRRGRSRRSSPGSGSTAPMRSTR